MAVPNTSKFIYACLLTTNFYRAKHGARPVKLNPEISEISQKWANRLSQEGQIYHSTTRIYKGQQLGENIALNFKSGGREVTGFEMVTQWYDELKDYNFRTHTGTGTGNMYDGDCHFTQLIWKDCSEVGFGIAIGQDGTVYLVSNYFPAGNVIGYYPQNVMLPGTVFQPPKPVGTVVPVGAGGRISRTVTTTGRTSHSPKRPSHQHTQLHTGRSSSIRNSVKTGVPHTSSFEHRCLKIHNDLRKRHQNTPELRLNAELCSMAQKWAEVLASRNKMAWSGASYQGRPVGENIGVKSGSVTVDFTGEEIVRRWYSQESNYVYANPDVNAGNSTGNFTQIVWKDTKELGVGKAFTHDSKTVFVVCNYFPHGNDRRRFKENVFPPIKRPSIKKHVTIHTGGKGSEKV